jgi:hypothetical protein
MMDLVAQAIYASELKANRVRFNCDWPEWDGLHEHTKDEFRNVARDAIDAYEKASEKP